MKSDSLLIEIGTEELPPKALRALSSAFAGGIEGGLAERRLEHGAVRPYASPRRLAVLVENVPNAQADREVELKGPPVSVAFDDDGNPKPAATAFAKKAGVDVGALERLATDKGEWLVCRTTERGAPLANMVIDLVEDAVRGMPIPRAMRWGSADAEFVRPVHWLVILHGSQVLPGSLFGRDAGNLTFGHRFHAPGPFELACADDYPELLATRGRVLPDLDARRLSIRDSVQSAAQEAGGTPVAGDALYDEVAALVEWPVPVTGRFDPEFLDLPREVVIATLTNHQRYFPLEDDAGKLLPAFVTVANIDSQAPDKVRDGNERVIRPRLADAAFFWRADRETPLADRLEALDRVVYQKGLGSAGDKARRVSALAGSIAGEVGVDRESAARAGLLSKCDLLTGMVGEFPELQGTMGGYYAGASDESDTVSAAIGEHYQPAFAGDAIPASAVGRVVALADRLDTLAGIFALGKRPSGNKDPFGLRRAALGIVRILIEGELDLDLSALIDQAAEAQPIAVSDEEREALYDFVIDRLKGYAADELSSTALVFEAVRARRPATLTDFAARLDAVRAFVALDEAASLAAANKRIGNILRQAEVSPGEPDPARFTDAAEKALFEELAAARDEVTPLLERRAYTAALTKLAGLRDFVDRFFDDVMVMADDESVRDNRLRLLASLNDQFLNIADISGLAIR